MWTDLDSHQLQKLNKDMKENILEAKKRERNSVAKGCAMFSAKSDGVSEFKILRIGDYFDIAY